MPLYHLEAARSEEQRQKMVDLEEAGVCVFCKEHLEAHQAEPVEWTGEYWAVVKNAYPYQGSRFHYLLVATRHVRDIAQLPYAAGAELFSVVCRLNESLGIESGAVVIRTGDMRGNGGSIEHLHIHYIVGDVSDPDHQPIRVKISSVIQ